MAKKKKKFKSSKQCQKSVPTPTHGGRGGACKQVTRPAEDSPGELWSLSLSLLAPSCFTSSAACCPGDGGLGTGTGDWGLGPAGPRLGLGEVFPRPLEDRAAVGPSPALLPGRLTSLRPSPPCPPSAHMGSNVFITCLTRCLIASPLNGAVTVETRNKRPPENEMIKQVTLAKQTQPRNLWGWGGQAPLARPGTGSLHQGGTTGPGPREGWGRYGGAPPAGQRRSSAVLGWTRALACSGHDSGAAGREALVRGRSGSQPGRRCASRWTSASFFPLASWPLLPSHCTGIPHLKLHRLL